MRILAINGSPKGKQSNTWRLTSSFIEGITAQEEDAHGQAPTVDALSVGALDIKPCRGCFSCWSKTPGKCCIHDDMQEIIERILQADVVIWSFPLYYFGLPGPLKNLIDRQLPMSLPFMSAEAENGGHPSRYDMSGKRTVVISTCGFYTAKGNYSCERPVRPTLRKGRLHCALLRPRRAFQGERAGGAHRRVPFLGQKGRGGVRIQRHQRGDPRQA